jgi:hypothetical protein
MMITSQMPIVLPSSSVLLQHNSLAVGAGVGGIVHGAAAAAQERCSVATPPAQQLK